ncbi:formylglycine-generating enzyme family protein [Polyangium spumosum]|uniref:SUMF1/EgtB/PvdO family nonheme iron enzyme n=1 Tax=Polyangium spumosum TaxID=889282 RepID=A0A6N7Q0B7_9BACT|nr:SUMF1/EgtB/PvdO family nonheme iron enzyme [Polyangium spumosum]MRG94401.1 SUMF1/EgtB/PvdO family nonheme iron enzyme [Polyangium spumosum]
MKALRWLAFGTALSGFGCGGGAQEGAAVVKEPAPAEDKPQATKSDPEPATTAAAPTAAPEATAAPAPEPPKAPPSPCPEGMAFIQGGAYKMGFLKNEAKVADFCLDKTEATAKDYEACVESKKCNEAFVTCAPEATYKKAGKEDHPMVCVDFQQAIDYCGSQGKRLPSDEEWEWAARGGEEGRVYPWGNEAPKDQLCWSGGKEGLLKGTCPVAAHPAGASKDGLLGLAGNVFEWTTSVQDSRTKDRVGRGASWRDGIPNMFRNERPGRFQVTYRCGFLGIRCAMPPRAAAGQ